MKLTSLTISPQSSWSSVGPENPLKAVVKLSSEKSTIECVLSEDAMQRMLSLCADEIAKQAEQRVAEFVSAVSAIEGDKAAVLIGSE